jgi:hypothetical protein
MALSQGQTFLVSTGVDIELVDIKIILKNVCYATF